MLQTQSPEISQNRSSSSRLCKGGQGERPNPALPDEKHKQKQRPPCQRAYESSGHPSEPSQGAQHPQVCPQLASKGGDNRPHSNPSSEALLLLICLATVEKSLVAKPSPQAAEDFSFEVVPNDNTVIETKPALLENHNWGYKEKASLPPQNMLSWPAMGSTFFSFSTREP